MNISFTEIAEADLSAIQRYVAELNPAKSEAYVGRILQSIRTLGQFPLMGRPGRVDETRELILPGMPYIVVYHIKSETELEVLTIKHGRQQYP